MDRQIPAKLREAAEHAFGYFTPVAPPAYLALGNPGSRRRYRDEVTLVHDRYAAPHYLLMTVSPGFNVGEPDQVTVRVGTDFDDQPHDYASCAHKPGTLSLGSRWAHEAFNRSC